MKAGECQLHHRYNTQLPAPPEARGGERVRERESERAHVSETGEQLGNFEQAYCPSLVPSAVRGLCLSLSRATPGSSRLLLSKVSCS